MSAANPINYDTRSKEELEELARNYQSIRIRKPRQAIVLVL